MSRLVLGYHAVKLLLFNLISKLNIVRPTLIKLLGHHILHLLRVNAAHILPLEVWSKDFGGLGATFLSRAHHLLIEVSVSVMLLQLVNLLILQILETIKFLKLHLLHLLKVFLALSGLLWSQCLITTLKPVLSSTLWTNWTWSLRLHEQLL